MFSYDFHYEVKSLTYPRFTASRAIQAGFIMEAPSWHIAVVQDNALHEFDSFNSSDEIDMGK